MRTAIVVQARMTSTRLPGKVMKQVLSRPLLAHLVDRLSRSAMADGVIIATTRNFEDLPIIHFCQQAGIPYFCGSEQDVLGRYHAAAKRYGVEAIVRVTSDCPLMDPTIVDQAIALYHSAPGDYDYLSNTLNRTFPRGMDVEIFSFAALTEAHHMAVEAPQREHVTPFFYQHPERYLLGNFTQEANEASLRLTVDTPEDLEMIARVMEELHPQKPHFGLSDIRELLKNRPEWAQLNAHVVQKSLKQYN